MAFLWERVKIINIRMEKLELYFCCILNVSLSPSCSLIWFFGRKTTKNILYYRNYFFLETNPPTTPLWYSSYLILVKKVNVPSLPIVIQVISLTWTFFPINFFFQVVTYNFHSHFLRKLQEMYFLIEI